MRTILVLGAGLIARPLLRYLLTNYEYRVIVGTVDVPRARQLMGEHPRGRVVELNVDDRAAASATIAAADIVVSLLPASLNPQVAALCLEHRKDMVNSSYASPEMLALDEAAQRNDIVILCEIGLDPGIDHMSAAATIRRIQEIGGTVTAFTSSCGGFPAPDANTNPWGYKFSWSPEAVMRAGRQPACYLRDGVPVHVPGPELFAVSWPYEVQGQGVFENYPNRDATRYIQPYGLDGVRNMFRGTLRYSGWCATMYAAARLGLLDETPCRWEPGATFRDFLTRLLPKGSGCIATRVADHLGIPVDSEVIARMEWAGLFSDRPLPVGLGSPLEVFGQRLRALMMYEPGERDMVALKHVFTVTYPDGSREEIQATLVQTGEPWGDSAMARSVSLPAAMATSLVLHRGITARGVLIPTRREIYEPVLAELEERGIALTETHIKSFRSPFDA